MGTTAAILAFGADQVYSCNLGDSRIYRVSPGRTDTSAFAGSCPWGRKIRQAAADTVSWDPGGKHGT